MRRVFGLLLLVAVFLRAGPGWAVEQPILLQNAAAANGNGQVLTTTGFHAVTLQVTGTFSATVNFEGAADATNYVAIRCTNINSDARVTSVTAAAIVQCNTQGLSRVRARISSYVSGSVTVTGFVLDVPLGASSRGSGLPAVGSEGDCLLVSSGSWAPGECPGAGGGAPTDATYLTQTANATLSAEQALGALATGILKNTTTTGVLSIAAAGTDYVAPAGNVATATALAANGANCSAGQAPLGVNASGAAETCTDYQEEPASNGIVAKTAANTSAARTITGTANEISVSNGDGVSGNPTISLPSSIDLGGKSVEIPNSASLPANCTTGQVYVDTSATSGSQFYVCETTDTWVPQGAAGSTPTLDQAFDQGKVIDGANSLANAVRIGDGTTPWCIYTDASDGPIITPCTDANVRTRIPTNFTWALYDVEGAAAVETIDPDAATQIGKYTYGTAYKPLKSVWFGAGSLSTDGTQCAAPAEVTINSGPKLWTIICTDNDASTIYGSIKMPDSWDGGTVTFTHVYLQTAADTSALNGDIAAQCRGNGEAPSSTWGTEVAIDDAAVTGSNQNDMTTSAAVTPAGTCAAGDMLYFRYQLDATGTTTAVATLHHLGFTMEYSVTSRSD